MDLLNRDASPLVVLMSEVRPGIGSRYRPVPAVTAYELSEVMGHYLW
jgi:hypothetical protein